MPKITAGEFNLGKPSQSTRINSFDIQNPPKLSNQQIAEILKIRLETKANLLKLQQQRIQNIPKLAILIDSNEYSSDDLTFINFIKDDTSNSKYTIFFYKNLLDKIEELYNLGFRFFASPTIGSFNL